MHRYGVLTVLFDPYVSQTGRVLLRYTGPSFFPAACDSGLCRTRADSGFPERILETG